MSPQMILLGSEQDMFRYSAIPIPRVVEGGQTHLYKSHALSFSRLRPLISSHKGRMKDSIQSAAEWTIKRHNQIGISTYTLQAAAVMTLTPGVAVRHNSRNNS